MNAPDFRPRPFLAWSAPEHWSREGVAWHDAPLPRLLHRCRAQTRGWVGFTQIERCACGAMRSSTFHWWSGYNTRRRFRIFR